MAGLTAEVAKRLPGELRTEAARLAAQVEKNRDVHKSYSSFSAKLEDVIGYLTEPDTKVDVILSDHGVPVSDWVGTLREYLTQVEAAGHTVEPDVTAGKLLASQVSAVRTTVELGLMDAVTVEDCDEALAEWSDALGSLGTRRTRGDGSTSQTPMFPFKVALFRPDGEHIGTVGRNTGVAQSFNIRSRLNDVLPENAQIPPRDETWAAALATLRETGKAVYNGYRMEKEESASVAA